MTFVIGAFFVVMFFGFFFASTRNNNPAPADSWDPTQNWAPAAAAAPIINLPRGRPARAILLSVAATGTTGRVNGQRFDVRRARVDIEEPNGAPYVQDTDLYIPKNLTRDTLPGSTMEVRLQKARIYVVGPDVGYAQGGVRTS